MAGQWSTSAAELDLHLELPVVGGRRVGLEQALRDAIRAGQLAPQTALPSTRLLAQSLNVARGTVSAAYDQLVAEGYLTARHGSGTAVAEVPPAPSGPGALAQQQVEPLHDLRPGQPDPTTFPRDAWLRSTRRVLATAPPDAFCRGDPHGRPELRSALAGYLGRVRGVLVSPDQILITAGYSQALGLLATVLAEQGASTVAMEEPGHPVHREIVKRAGLRVASLPVDVLGARTDLLSTTRYATTDAVVVTPAHQYPTGATLHPDRRRALISWARTTGGLVIEDDYDGEFRYDRQPVGAVQGMGPGAVVYAGTASKALSPALRLGWIAAPKPLADRLSGAKGYADAASPSLSQLVLADLIDTHAYDRHIRSARLRYRRRRDLLLARLHAAVPQVQVSGVAAGLHALLKLPVNGPSENEILASAAERGLALQPLADHWQRAGEHQPGLIVGYSAPAEHAWPAALEALCTVLRTLLHRERSERARLGYAHYCDPVRADRYRGGAGTPALRGPPPADPGAAREGARVPAWRQYQKRALPPAVPVADRSRLGCDFGRRRRTRVR